MDSVSFSLKDWSRIGCGGIVFPPIHITVDSNKEKQAGQDGDGSSP